MGCMTQEGTFLSLFCKTGPPPGAWGGSSGRRSRGRHTDVCSYCRAGRRNTAHAFFALANSSLSQETMPKERGRGTWRVDGRAVKRRRWMVTAVSGLLRLSWQSLSHAKGVDARESLWWDGMAKGNYGWCSTAPYEGPHTAKSRCSAVLTTSGARCPTRQSTFCYGMPLMRLRPCSAAIRWRSDGHAYGCIEEMR
jgi:hypothetical protein